jgi:hypothetical protein
MAESHDIESVGRPERPRRRVILGAVAAAGMLAPAVRAAPTTRSGERRPQRHAGTGASPGVTEQHVATPEVGAAGQVWGTSRSGRGAGVRGNGRWGVVGEGTHTGVSGDGLVGVRGATSIVQGDQGGVGVWAQAVAPGSSALRADGPSEFNGVTKFSRSGVTRVRRGSRSVRVADVALTADTVILATLQNRQNGIYLHAVETNAAENSFTIFLSGAPERDVRIGWFALG